MIPSIREMKNIVRQVVRQSRIAEKIAESIADGLARKSSTRRLSSDWEPYEGPRGGKGKKNRKTGQIVYGDEVGEKQGEKPIEKLPSKSGKAAKPSETVAGIDVKEFRAKPVSLMAKRLTEMLDDDEVESGVAKELKGAAFDALEGKVQTLYKLLDEVATEEDAPDAHEGFAQDCNDVLSDYEDSLAELDEAWEELAGVVEDGDEDDIEEAKDAVREAIESLTANNKKFVGLTDSLKRWKETAASERETRQEEILEEVIEEHDVDLDAMNEDPEGWENVAKEVNESLTAKKLPERLYRYQGTWYLDADHEDYEEDE